MSCVVTPCYITGTSSCVRRTRTCGDRCHATETAPPRPLHITPPRKRCEFAAAPIMYPFGRTSSGFSGKSGKAKLNRQRTTLSFQQQALQNDEEDKPKVYQGRFAVYNGLEWEQLKEFLESRFEGWTFKQWVVRPLFLNERCPLGGRLSFANKDILGPGPLGF